MAIKRLFIANRGEIAVRIVKAAQAMGIHTIQAYSEADDSMLAVRMADEAVCIGAAQSALSYLNVEGIVEAAKSTNADAVHPGYGFLAENADFVRALDAAGIVFVGPSADTIDRMGDKVSARQAAQAAGVPVVPGSKGRLDTTDDAIKLAADIGYPVMIKAAAGGGGKGIRIATNEEDLRKMAPQAQAEAKASFGDGGLYLERAIQSPRHIEVQILGDGVDAIHCFERECSMQRRRQKVWEEAGAICLDEATRSHLCDTAVALAKAVKYRGAGTLEYLYDANTKEFYFIEMNTRLQVEHPVAEAVTGLDLVALQIRIAQGAPPGIAQADFALSGHAIDARLHAEAPGRGGGPSAGPVALWRPPGAHRADAGIAANRADAGIAAGGEVSARHDPMVAKPIARAPTREEARRRLITALRGTAPIGPDSGAAFLIERLEASGFAAGRATADWLVARWPGGWAPCVPSAWDIAPAAAPALLADRDVAAARRRALTLICSAGPARRPCRVSSRCAAARWIMPSRRPRTGAAGGSRVRAIRCRCASPPARMAPWPPRSMAGACARGSSPGRRAPRSCARAASFAGPAPRRGAARRAARARGA